MSLPELNNDFDDELLSAYVDDELTAEERVRVEARLRTDPRAVQLVEQLRALSGALKSLPRETLGRDLRAGVLAAAAEAKGSAGLADTIALADHRHDHFSGIRRGLIWSAVAIAAALMLMFVQAPDERGAERSVADGSSTKEKADERKAPAPALPEMGAADDAQSEAEAVDGLAALDPAAEPRAPASGELVAPIATSAPSGAADGKLAGTQGAMPGSPPPATADQPLDKLSEYAYAAGAAPAAMGRARTLDDGANALAVSATPTVELILKSPRSLARFEELLDRTDIALSDAERPADEESARDAAEADTSLVESPAPRAVLVEASPGQIAQLMSSYRGEAKLFEEVRVEGAGHRELGDLMAAKDLKKEAAESGGEGVQMRGGGVGGGGLEAAEEGQAAVAEAPAEARLAESTREELTRGQVAPPARAWRLSSSQIDRKSHLGLGEMRFLEAAQPSQDASVPAARTHASDSGTAPLGAFGTRIAIDRQGANHVRVLFVFRAPPAAVPAPAAAKAAN